MIRLMVRGYLGRVLQFARPLEVTENNLDRVLPKLAEEHAQAMADGLLGMIEIEFVDDAPDPFRFFRIGVDPRGMVIPVAFDLLPRHTRWN